MFRQALIALFALTLAACATTRPRANTHSLLHRVDSSFFLQAQCQPTRTASLTPEQVTGLDELPAALRTRVLTALPMQAVGMTKRAQCQDVTAQLLESRLRALCWREATVTRQADAGPSTPLPRLAVQLGGRTQVGKILIVHDRDLKLPPARIIQTAESALPKDRACTAGTLDDIRERVSKLGTFDEVLVSAGIPDSGEKNVPVVIDIRGKAPAPSNAGTPPGAVNGDERPAPRGG
jgi:hypothetical protein